jgi:hypothetical protein
MVLSRLELWDLGAAALRNAAKKFVELRLIYSGLPLHHLLGFVKFT